MAPHFEKVFTSEQPTTRESLYDILQRENMQEIDRQTEWEELLTAFKKLAKDKSAGLKNIPLDIFKELSL